MKKETKLKLQKWMFSPCQTACYVLSDETGEAVIIDACAYYESERRKLLQYITEEKLRPVRLLLTHGHYDHMFSNDLIRDRYGLLPEVHSADAPLVKRAMQRIEEVLGPGSYPYDIPMPGHLLAGNELIKFGSHELQVIHTPGHSPGSVFFYCKEEGIAFSGDTLLYMTIGRSDLPGGSQETLQHSLELITSMLPDETVLHPGHTRKTTIGHEKACNPYI